MTAPDYEPLYLEGIEKFNACDYFESHEVWEELWTEYRGEARKFYQGLIQAAVALYHFGNGNLRGARKLHGSVHGYLEPYLPSYLGLDLVTFLRDFDRCLADVVADVVADTWAGAAGAEDAGAFMMRFSVRWRVRLRCRRQRDCGLRNRRREP